MTVRITALLLLASAAGFAEGWPGVLVDSNCYSSEERNVTKSDGPAERDMSLELQACTPGVKTKNFAVVLMDWDVLRFEQGGNERARDFVRSAGGKSGSGSTLRVTVNGELSGNTIAVASVSGAR